MSQTTPSHMMLDQQPGQAPPALAVHIKQEPDSQPTPAPFSPSLTPNGAKAKLKKGSTTNKKTIKTAGSGPERVAQACDRCRAKKTKCDGKLPACSGCAAVGIKCIVSDKLSRRAYPKGYTETLEERIRQLEAENNRLTGLIDLRDEQIKTINTSLTSSTDENRNISTSPSDSETPARHNHVHGDSCPCGCSTNPGSVHERPVSIALSMTDDDHGPLSIANSLNLSDEDETNSLLSTDDELISNSLGSILLQRNKLYSNRFSSGEKPAPGAFAAATAIEQMQKASTSKSILNQQQMLTALVAASIPRSTEETLFIPTMLANICQHFGYDSKPAVLAANAIGSLKQNSNEVNDDSQSYDRLDEQLLKLIMNRRNTAKLNNEEAAYFLRNLQLPSSRMAMDHLITIYFQEWGNFLPVLNRNSFLTSYDKFTNILETGQVGNSDSSSFAGESIERFGAIMILVFALSYLSNKHSFFSTGESKKEQVDKYVQEIRHYDYLIHEFVKPHCLITGTCSIQSLQILTLALQYFLAIGDVSGCFELRGRVITMAQQLRLHRCPAAVLGVSTSGHDDANLRNLQQGERRILFWCLYCLDVYSSLNLGVPRLLKDFEIECALPFAGKTTDDDEEENENILIVNNTKLTIVGKVSRFALNIMLYCQVLGSILDSIYSSVDYTTGTEATSKLERQLECWRRELSQDLRFEIDSTGFSLKSETENGNHWLLYSKQQLALIFLYFHARILIYLPVLSKYGNHHDVTLSAKEKLLRGEGDRSQIISSGTMIQQSSIQILQVLQTCARQPNSYLLPVPVNVPREHSRLALLVAKGSLDYMKGGPLFHSSKLLLLDTIPLLSRESRYEVPGGLAKNSAKLLEMALLSLLGIPQNKNPLLNKKKQLTSPIIRQAVNRTPANPKSNLDKSIGAEDILEFLEEFNPDDNVENVLEFDPFKVNLSQQLLMNEFAADGSLGLVPFLESTQDESDDSSDNNFMSFFDPRQLE